MGIQLKKLLVLTLFKEFIEPKENRGDKNKDTGENFSLWHSSYSNQ